MPAEASSGASTGSSAATPLSTRKPVPQAQQRTLLAAFPFPSGTVTGFWHLGQATVRDIGGSMLKDMRLQWSRYGRLL
jgi:hypothetical protein